MLPLKTILCPTDFSEASYRALETAIELALHFSAQLCLIHVVLEVPRPERDESRSREDESPVLDISEYEEMIHTLAQQRLHQVIAERVPKAVPARALVETGDAAAEIVRVANEERADLIVIATQGKTGLNYFVFGSVTEKVVHLADCPVLTIHASSEGRGNS